jgi:hypothetical protein
MTCVKRKPYTPSDPNAMEKALKQMNRMREETRKKMGELDVAVFYQLPIFGVIPPASTPNARSHHSPAARSLASDPRPPTS